MSDHVPMPRLCNSCLAAVLAIAKRDPRPYFMRMCESNSTLAFGFRRGPTGAITHWELHTIGSDGEAKLHAERITEIYLSGQCATGRRP